MSSAYYAILKNPGRRLLGFSRAAEYLLPQGTTLAGGINIHAVSFPFYQQSDSERDRRDERRGIFSVVRKDEMRLRPFFVIIISEISNSQMDLEDLMYHIGESQSLSVCFNKTSQKQVRRKTKTPRATSPFL